MNAAQTAMPADAGRGRLVDLARARLVEHPVAARDPRRDRDERRGEREGDHEHERREEGGRQGHQGYAAFCSRSSR